MENNIHVETSEGVLIIREGQAEEIQYKKRVELKGTIGSILDFVKKRSKTFLTNEAHAIFDVPARTITFMTQEQDNPGYTISGTMIPHPFIAELGINVPQKTYSIYTLLNTLKMYGRFFTTRAEHAAICSALSKFSAKTEVEFKDHNDYKGNTAFVKITSVKHEIPLVFTLKLPIYRGQPAEEFLVDIEVYPDNGSILCKVISIPLAEKMDEILNAVFDGAEEELKEYVIIKK